MVQPDAEVSSASSILSGSDDGGETLSEAGSVATSSTTPCKRKLSKAASKKEKKSKKKRKASGKGTDDDAAGCDDCGADPAEDDPVRQLSIQKRRHETFAKDSAEPDNLLKPMLIHWGKPRKFVNGKMVAPGKRCYYCNRTRRSKAAYRKLKKKEWKEYMANEEFKEQFVKDRAITVLTLFNRGMDCRIGENDYNNSTFVDMVEAAGERTWRGGVKMREDVFMKQYSAEQRKTLNIKKEQKYNLVTCQIDTWVRIFDDVEGIERFELYQDNGIQKKKQVHDNELGDENEADEAFRDGAQEILGAPNIHKNAITKADIGYVENQKSQRFEKEVNKKKKLKKHDSTGSSVTAGSSSSSASFGVMKDKLKRHQSSKKAAAKKKAGKAPLTSPAKDNNTGSPAKAPLSVDSISGYQLDKPTAKKDQAFVRTVDVKLRECKQCHEQVTKAEALDQIVDDDFVNNIRKLCGMEKKVLDLQLTKCKANRTRRICRYTADKDYEEYIDRLNEDQDHSNNLHRQKRLLDEAFERRQQRQKVVVVVVVVVVLLRR